MLRFLVPASLALASLPIAAPQGPAPGMRYYGPHNTTETYMVDTSGTIVHTWPSGFEPGNGIYMDDDGSLVRAVRLPGAPTIGGAGGGAQRIAFDGTILWDFAYANADVWHHHDIELMPNGNILFIVWDRMTEAEAVDAGRNPALITGGAWLPDSIVEIEPVGATGGNVVWEWHVMDHVIQDFDNTKANFGVVADHPELLDINYPPTLSSNGDWNHANSIDYDPGSDLILLNFPFQDEFYLIDHSTTTAEAAGHTGGNFGKGGDFLYRWGNPAAYGAGTVADQQLFNQHSTKFIPPGLPGAGNVLLFNNQWGSQFGINASALFELELPASFALAPGAAWGPSAPVWEYTAPLQTDFYSSGLSSAERLPNGHTLVDSGRQDGWLFELDTSDQIVWEYFNQLPFPSTLVFQVSYTERTLWADREEFSAGAGGSVDFDFLSGTAHAGEFYILLGSVTGTSPGFSSSGVFVPLVPDDYFIALMLNAGSPVLPGSVGNLDANGGASAGLNLAPGLVSGLVGVTLYHSVLTVDGGGALSHASNAVPLSIEP